MRSVEIGKQHIKVKRLSDNCSTEKINSIRICNKVMTYVQHVRCLVLCELNPVRHSMDAVSSRKRFYTEKRFNL